MDFGFWILISNQSVNNMEEIWMIVIVKIRKPNVPPNFSDFQSLLLYTSAILKPVTSKNAYNLPKSQFFCTFHRKLCKIHKITTQKEYTSTIKNIGFRKNQIN